MDELRDAAEITPSLQKEPDRTHGSAFSLASCRYSWISRSVWNPTAAVHVHRVVEALCFDTDGGTLNAGVGSTKYELSRHLSHLGFELGRPREQVRQELRRHMGEARFAEYNRLASVRGGDDAQNRVYDFMQDMREANLVRSSCLDATLDTSFYLYTKCVPELSPGKRVTELACWTGGLASFIAEKHPEVTVVGVDRARRIIDVNRSYFDLPNLSFVEWDYRNAKPDVLERADVLLCGLGINNDVGQGAYEKCDPRTVRESEGYHREREEGLKYFNHWRQAANDGASLITVLRVFTFPRFLAFLDAAQVAGWTPLLDESTFIQVPSNKERIPSLLFKATPSNQLVEDVALSHWMRITTGKPEFALMLGPTALAFFRVLSERQVLSHRAYRNDLGFITEEEIGTCGAFGYIFEQDTRPEHCLVLTTVDHVESMVEARQQPPAQSGTTIVSGLINCSKNTFTIYSEPVAVYSPQTELSFRSSVL